VYKSRPVVFTHWTPPCTSVSPLFCICYVWFIPSCHTVQAEVVGFSETFLNLYHTAPCHTSNDSNASDVQRSNPQSKLLLSVLSIRLPRTQTSASYSQRYITRYVTQSIGRPSFLYLVFTFAFFGFLISFSRFRTELYSGWSKGSLIRKNKQINII